jgi:ribosomal protein L18E
MYVDVLYLNVTQTINNNMIIKTKRKTSAMVDYKLASQLENNIRNRRGKNVIYINRATTTHCIVVVVIELVSK